MVTQAVIKYKPFLKKLAVFGIVVYHIDKLGKVRLEMERVDMRISTKGRYALRLMLDLAMYNTGKPVRIKEIAGRQEISDKYLEQIISILNKARFVRSVRGPQGGYLLTKKPEEYTVGMILRLTEGSMAPVECIDDAIGGCTRLDSCATSIVWHKLNDAISDVIDHITLADLVEWQVYRNGEYNI